MRAIFGLFLAGALSAMEQLPPNWSVTDINGQIVASNGQVIILVFAAPCTPVDTLLNQTLKPLSAAYPDVLTVLLFPTLSEDAVRGWCAQRGGIPSNMCAVSLPPTDLLAAMYFEPGTNIWPTTWMLNRKGKACFKWRSFVQKSAMESIMCAELAPLRIRKTVGGVMLSWKTMPIQPTIQWIPSMVSYPGWHSFIHPWPFHTNGAGYSVFPAFDTGFYQLKWAD